MNDYRLVLGIRLSDVAESFLQESTPQEVLVKEVVHGDVSVVDSVQLPRGPCPVRVHVEHPLDLEARGELDQVAGM